VIFLQRNPQSTRWVDSPFVKGARFKNQPKIGQKCPKIRLLERSSKIFQNKS
jgi:hypothetical protein